MKINWKVRLKNKYFWLTIVPALFLLVGQVLRALGIDYDMDAVIDSALKLAERELC